MVPVFISKNTLKIESIKDQYFFILIDDDELVRMSWEISAKKENIQFKAFSSVSEFLSEKENFSKKSEIFIDSYLGENLMGEDEARKIYDLGFHNISLASGKDFENRELFPWIKKNQGKKVPWIISS